VLLIGLGYGQQGSFIDFGAVSPLSISSGVQFPN